MSVRSIVLVGTVTTDANGVADVDGVVAVAAAAVHVAHAAAHEVDDVGRRRFRRRRRSVTRTKRMGRSLRCNRGYQYQAIFVERVVSFRGVVMVVFEVQTTSPGPDRRGRP